MVRSLRNQEIQFQFQCFTGQLGDLNTSGTTCGKNRHPRDFQDFNCTLTGIIQHVTSLTISRCAVICRKLDLELDFEQAQRSNFRYCFSPIMGIQFPKDMVDVTFNRPYGDHKLLCNLLVRRTTSHQAHYFQFALAELFARFKTVPIGGSIACTCKRSL